MRKAIITKGSELTFMDETFLCRYYDGTYVWGRSTALDGSIFDNRLYTLNEIALKMREVDGKNYKVYWEE